MSHRPVPRAPASYRLLLVSSLLLFAAATPLLFVIYRRFYPVTDFSVFWIAAGAWLDGLDPYGAEATRRIYTSDHSGFAYPFPALLAVAPFALLPYEIGVALWSALGLTLYLILPWLLGSRLPLHVALLSVIYFPLAASLEEAQWGPLLVGLAGIVLHLGWRGKAYWSGFMLPLLDLKPNLGLPLTISFGASSLLERQQRWWLGVLAGTVCWWLLPLLLLPSWPLGWWVQLQKYRVDGGADTLLFTPYLGPLLLLASLPLILLSARRKDTTALFAAAVVCNTIIIPTRLYNLLLLWLPLLLLMRQHPLPAALCALLSWATIGFGLMGWAVNVAILAGLVLPLLVLTIYHLQVAAAQPPGFGLPSLQSGCWDHKPHPRRKRRALRR